MINTDLACFLPLTVHIAKQSRSSLRVWFQFLENEEVVRRREEKLLPCKSIIVQDISEIQL